MALSVSTGLRDYMAATGSLKSGLDGGFIKIYSGTAPASANDPVTGTLLAVISLNATATGLTLEGSAGLCGVQKPAAAVWSGTVSNSGVAGYFRHVAPDDTGTLSSTERRVQGAVGAAGAELLLSNTTLAAAALQTIDSYTLLIPG